MNHDIRVLMIDDDEEDFMILSDIVAEIDHYHVRADWVSTHEEGMRHIRNKTHDIYLVDYHLDDNTGLELISEAIQEGCEEPLILLTGRNDYELDTAVMKAGASDYLIKGSINAQLLERSMRYSIASTRHVKAMRSLNAELEERVKTRTLILESTLNDLEQSKAELKESLNKEKELNELKSRFVSTVSHEFRTPLGVILSSLSLVSKYGEKGDVLSLNRHVQKIEQSVCNLTDLLNDLLSIGKQEEGKVSMITELINIRETSENVLEEMRRIAKPGQQIIYHHIGSELIFLNKKIISHILTNLVSNAIKFSEENKTITVFTEANREQFQLRVKDEGIGISEKDQEHLFERFFRAANAINIKGTGLGLNIIAGYLKLIGGNAKVESSLGKGTTISVALPVEVQSATAHRHLAS